MANISIVFLFLVVICFIGIPVGLFFAIKALIRYNAKVNNKKDSKQDELDKMKIEDL